MDKSRRQIRPRCLLWLPILHPSQTAPEKPDEAVDLVVFTFKGLQGRPLLEASCSRCLGLPQRQPQNNFQHQSRQEGVPQKVEPRSASLPAQGFKQRQGLRASLPPQRGRASHMLSAEVHETQPRSPRVVREGLVGGIGPHHISFD